MDKAQFIEYVQNRLMNGQNTEINYEIRGNVYKIKLLCPDSKKGINIPSIIMIPLMSSDRINNQICVESNNLETDNMEAILEQGSEAGIRLANLTDNKPCPIVIPLIPSEKDGPYYQQLSRECFNLQPTDLNYRIDEQVVRIIEQTKSILNDEFNIKAKDKIFLNGYSSSGVFAQRFSLLHPEIIDTVCIGGASGSIPVLSEKIGYPIGIADYENITGKRFDSTSFSKIVFRYYVGELESISKANDRFDENGDLAPMHDMSYFDRSVPKDVGQLQRNLFGRDMFDRANETVKILRAHGMNITHTVFRGRTHGNKSGHGVNEKGDKFINDTYMITLQDKKIYKDINDDI